MAKINLPKDMLAIDAFKTLPAKEKEEYVTNLLKKILDLNREGITISQIREFTGMTYSTIWHHLEVLNCVEEVRKISRGNLDVYYPSGNITILKEHLDTKGKARYIISTMENNDGNFVCVHQKRQNRLGNYTVCRGIGIPYELIDDLIEDLKKIKKSVKKK